MPSLGQHQSKTTTKLVLIGDNGSGKTGGIASLVTAGYNVRILDLDNGLDILANLLKDEKGPYARPGVDWLSKVHFITVTDPMKNQNGKLVPRSASVWQRTMKLLDGKPDERDKDDWPFGPISTWTEDDVLVIDSLSMLATSAMNFILSMNARLGQRPHQSDWYDGQQLLEGFFQMIYDEGVKCNVVLNAHIVYIGEKGPDGKPVGPQKGYPATLGSALSPKMGTYFNTILMVKTQGFGTGAKPKILTKSQGLVELKNSSPFQVAPEYDLSTGLADYFKAVRGNSPGAK
jgi:hypothetical protein